MKIRLLALVLSVLLIVTALPFSVFAADSEPVAYAPITSTDANETVYYKLVQNDDGVTYTLTFTETSPSGDGVIPDYTTDTSSALDYLKLPWRDSSTYRDKVTTVIFDSTITKIGTFVVANMALVSEYRILNPSASVSNHALYFNEDRFIPNTGVVISSYSSVSLPTSTFFGSKVTAEQKALVTYANYDSGEITDMLTNNGDGTYTLTVAGSGEMPSYSGVETPWAENNGAITKVVVSEGITSVSAGAFSALSGLKEADIAESVDTIAEGAFPSHAFVMKGLMNHASGRYAEAHPNVSLKLKKLRIFHMGNSHTDDHTYWMDIIIGDMYDAGFKTEFVREKFISGARGLYTEVQADRSAHYIAANDPENAHYQNYRNAFAKTWDIVIAQDFRESTSTNETYGGANFADELAICVDWLHTEAPGAKIIWFADWAERSFNGGDFDLSWNQSMAAIAAVNELSENKPDYIINAATILQNARTSYLAVTKNETNVIRNWNTDGGFTDFAKESIHTYPLLERDGTHMSLELGRYMMAESVLWQLINEFNDYLIKEESFDYFDCLKTTPEFTRGQSYWEGSFVPLYFDIFEEVARNAYTTPYAITSVSEQYKTDPFTAIFESVKSVIASVEVPENPTKEELVTAYTASYVISALNAIDGITVDASDITVNYSASTTKRKGNYSVWVDSRYGYSCPSEAAYSATLPLKPIVVYGQLNNDGTIDSADLNIVRKHLIGAIAEETPIAADVSGDGKYDILDVVIFNKYLEDLKNGITDIVLGPEITFSVFGAEPLSANSNSLKESTTGTFSMTKVSEGRDRYKISNLTETIAPKTITGNNYFQLSFSSVGTFDETKAALVYVEHIDATKPLNFNIFFNWRAIANGEHYYIYDLDKDEWQKIEMTDSGYYDSGDHGDLIQQVSSAGSYHTVPADFRGWILMPYTSIRDYASASATTIRFAPQYLGGDYGSIIFGDVTLVDDFDPIAEEEDLYNSVFKSTVSAKLGTDFPFNLITEKSDMSTNFRRYENQSDVQANVTYTYNNADGSDVKVTSTGNRTAITNEKGEPSLNGSDRILYYRITCDTKPSLTAGGSIMVYIKNDTTGDYRFITGNDNSLIYSNMPYYLLSKDSVSWSKHYTDSDTYLINGSRYASSIVIPEGFEGWLSIPLTSIYDSYNQTYLNTKLGSLGYFGVCSLDMAPGTVYFSEIGASTMVTPTHFETDTDYIGLSDRITSGKK